MWVISLRWADGSMEMLNIFTYSRQIHLCLTFVWITVAGNNAMLSSVSSTPASSHVVLSMSAVIWTLTPLR